MDNHASIHGAGAKTDGTRPTIAVLGTGRMGSALVRAFLGQGYRTDIWNRTRAKCEPLAAAGARVAATVRDAVAAADIVVVNVLDYATSDRLLRADDVAEALRGKLLVQLSSGSPRQAREAAAWAGARGIDYLDGAIMGTPNFIGEPGGTILYAGPGELFARARPVLAALGGNTLHVGDDVGHASALDSALLVVMWGQLFGTLQAAAICEAEGFPLPGLLAHVQAFMPVIDEGMVDLVERIAGGRLAGDDATLATLEAHHGALHHLLELCEHHGIDRAVPAAFDRLFRAAIAGGHAQSDFAVLHTFVRAPQR